jgi:hypothetical protein
MNSQYTLTVDWKVENVDGSCSLYIGNRGIDTAELHYVKNSPTNAFDWQTYSTLFFAAGFQVRIEIGLICADQSTADFFLDGVRVTPL